MYLCDGENYDDDMGGVLRNITAEVTCILTHFNRFALN